MNTKETLYNAQGQRVGTITHYSDGHDVLRDRNSLKVGHTDQGKAYDSKGHKVGSSNLLPSLLKR